MQLNGFSLPRSLCQFKQISFADGYVDQVRRNANMTTFDKREQGFEAKFIHDEELRFKITARRNKMLGNWAAGQLGLTGEAAVAYANELVTADLENQSDDDTMRRVSKDLAPQGVSEEQVRQRMEEFFHMALHQIEAGG
jgi:hypothetical protein